MLPPDYLVIGAGASGLAFTDALVDHDPHARVTIVDRRDGVGGHWRAAYPFVRLHQASSFYGVASTLLGGHRIQESGPEAGLHERADQPTILAYYEDVLARLLATGRVELRTGTSYDGAPLPHGRVVDARYLAPEVPAETPPRFEVDGVRVVPVNDLPLVEETPSQYVVLGSGKTATDACVWLLTNGVDPDAIVWVRPRDPWMLNRALIQPDPEVYLGMVADLMTAAAAATSLDGLFLALEEHGIMLRVDRSVTPTMAKAPTLGEWELALLRSIEHVVRLGRVVSARPGLLTLADGTVALEPDALIVNCAADGLKQPPLVPIWQPGTITLQPIRAGFPCFGAALAGYVEATRTDDAEKNRLAPPSPYGNTLADWARMNVLGTRATTAFNAEPDIRDWAHGVPLNPARIPPGHPTSPALDDARARIAAVTDRAVQRLSALSATAAG